jgi:hypothetical protein
MEPEREVLTQGGDSMPKHVRLSLLLLFAVPARARAEPAYDHDRAVATFEEGRRLLEQGNCTAAITKLNESLGHEPSVGARLSLADCYQNTDPLAAWRSLREAARLAYVKHDERLSVAQKRAAELEAKLPRVRVALPPAAFDDPGFELRLDGAPVDPYFYKEGLLAMEPGKHVIEASAPRRHFAQTIVAEATTPRTVSVALEPDVRPATPPAPTGGVSERRDDTGNTQRTLGIAVGAVGVAGVALGAAFGFVTLSKKNDLSNACGGNVGACTATPGSLDADREAAKAAATVSTVSFIVGGVAIASGVVLYVTAPRASAQTGRVGVAPAVGRNGAGLDLVGRW